MSKTITHLELGGTLFIPASHKNLYAIIHEKKYPNLKSLVIDFEDGLKSDDFAPAMEQLSCILGGINANTPLVFLRAKDAKHLEKLLRVEHIENVAGFVLAKFTLANAEEYLSLLENRVFLCMPSIEGKELFSFEKLEALKEKLLPFKDKVLIIRFGFEDMLRQLGMWRSCERSVFEYASTAVVMGNLIAIFKSAGFAISGGVYPCYKESEGFMRDLERDLKEGLFSKTIIHPSQIEFCNSAYRVTKEEFSKAEAILIREKEAVFAQAGAMVEVKTMSPFAKEIVKRAEIYGIKQTTSK